MSTGGRKLGEEMGCSIPKPSKPPNAWLKSWFTRSRREVNSKEGSLRVMFAIEMSPFWNWNLFSGWVGVGRAHKTWPHENMRCNTQWRREPAAAVTCPPRREQRFCLWNPGTLAKRSLRRHPKLPRKNEKNRSDCLRGSHG